MLLEYYLSKMVTSCRFLVAESRERVGYRAMPCIFVIVPWLKVRREGVFFMELVWPVVCYCLMIRVDKCPNEDLGPLPGLEKKKLLSIFRSLGSNYFQVS